VRWIEKNVVIRGGWRGDHVIRDAWRGKTAIMIRGCGTHLGLQAISGLQELQEDVSLGAILLSPLEPYYTS
jgi:hypothetical protein